MPNEEILYRLPLWSIAVGLAVLLLAAVGVARRYGQWDHDQFLTDEEDAASLSGASLGLLALLLAFIYSVATDHFDLRKQLVLKEANAIGTAHLRAGFAPEPQRTEIQGLLRTYTDLRIDFSEFTFDPRETARLHEEIWSAARRAIVGHEPTTIDALLVQALNDVIDVHSERLRAQRDHVPRP